jgi:hypothetical protein
MTSEQDCLRPTAGRRLAPSLLIREKQMLTWMLLGLGLITIFAWRILRDAKADDLRRSAVKRR